MYEDILTKYTGTCNIKFKNETTEFKFDFELDLNNDDYDHMELTVRKELIDKADYDIKRLIEMKLLSDRNINFSFEGTSTNGLKISCSHLIEGDSVQHIEEKNNYFSFKLKPLDKLTITNENIFKTGSEKSIFLITNLLFSGEDFQDRDNGNRDRARTSVNINNKEYSFLRLFNIDETKEKLKNAKNAFITTHIETNYTINLDNELNEVIWVLCRLCTFSERNFISPLYSILKNENGYLEINYHPVKTFPYIQRDSSISFCFGDSQNNYEEMDFHIPKDIIDNLIDNLDENKANYSKVNLKDSVKAFNQSWGTDYIYDFKIYLETCFPKYVEYSESLKLDVLNVLDVLTEFVFLSNKVEMLETKCLMLCIAFECLTSNSKAYFQEKDISIKNQSYEKTKTILIDFFNTKKIVLLENDLDDLLKKLYVNSNPTFKEKLIQILTKFNVNYSENEFKLLNLRNKIVHTGLMGKDFDSNLRTFKELSDFFDKVFLTIVGYKGKYRIVKSKDNKRELL